MLHSKLANIFALLFSISQVMEDGETIEEVKSKEEFMSQNCEVDGLEY